MNRNILESTHSMLYEVYLSQNFWAEAAATAVYLRNRSPSKFLKNVTPYEIFNENKPNVSHLKVFGCKAMVHIPKAKQNGKLNQQSAKCIFVGYPNDSKGYKFYNPVEKKMLHSNNVSFSKMKSTSTYTQLIPYFLIYTESSETNFVINENNKTFSNENISEEESKTQDTHEVNDRPQRVCRAPER